MSPPIWKSASRELLKSWVDAILDEASDELSEWEATFIEDMQYKINNGIYLTQKQQEKLEQIYADKTK